VDHDGPYCAQLGHYIASLVVAYCPHHQAWTAVVGVGDDTDDVRYRGETLRFGPFDSRADVLARLDSELGRMMRADHSAWLSARGGGGPVAPSS
jgi:hypothetical protein